MGDDASARAPDLNDTRDSAARSSADNIREATQLLLQAAERLSRSERSDTSGPQSSGRRPLRETIGENAHPRHISPYAASLKTPLRQQTLGLMGYRGSRRGQVKRNPVPPKMWQHSFVCLAKVKQFIPPDTSERVTLVQAGLGEKRLSCSLDCGADELHEVILSTFPRLRKGGGYELLKLDEASRKQLNVVPPPGTAGYNPVYLKAIFLQVNIFIRPLQNDLDVTPLAEGVSDDEYTKLFALWVGVGLPCAYILWCFGFPNPTCGCYANLGCLAENVLWHWVLKGL